MGYTGNRNWTIDATKQKLASTLSFRMLRAKSLMVSDHSGQENLDPSCLFVVPLVNQSDLFTPSLNKRKIQGGLDSGENLIVSLRFVFWRIVLQRNYDTLPKDQL